LNAVTDIDFDNDSSNTTGMIFDGGIFTEICGDSIIDSRDGKKYGTVLIGMQCWISQNMNVGSMISSTSGGQLQTNNDLIEKYCYNNDPAQCNIYGGMYEWPEAMQYIYTEGTQGICPDGWHMPTDEEFKILEGTVDSQYGVGDSEWDGSGYRGSDVGNNLKTVSGWGSSGGTNLSGFSALPAGRRDQAAGTYVLLLGTTYFWITQDGNSSPPFRGMSGLESRVKRNGTIFRYEGYSVRCLKD